jgi:hypothetical protein
MFRQMLEHDRKRAGWSAAQAAWRLGVSIREYGEIRGRRAVAELVRLEDRESPKKA